VFVGVAVGVLVGVTVGVFVGVLVDVAGAGVAGAMTAGAAAGCSVVDFQPSQLAGHPTVAEVKAKSVAKTKTTIKVRINHFMFVTPCVNKLQM